MDYPKPGSNIITATDAYKETHYKMYEDGTKHIGSYLEARTDGEYKDIVFFGLQHKLKEYFWGTVVTKDKINFADWLCKQTFQQDLFNRAGWEYILDKHQGKLPVKIRAVKEGTVVPEDNVLLTIQNTDPNCAWLVNHLETLLVQLWYPCTVATISRALKSTLKDALEKTGNPNNLPFMLHDFGYRGSTSVESAAIGGAAHLVNFLGTDTIAGMELLLRYYDTGDIIPGHSVPAAEHSTITSWGKEGELAAYENILDKYPTGIVSVVSDSWNVYNACKYLWGDKLKDKILSSSDRTVVIRPDSGEPIKVILQCLQILSQAFGSTVNDKGYRLLPPNVKLIQGDGITRHSLPEIVQALIDKKWSLDNIVFGSGGGLLQDCNRDTQKFAMKCNWTLVNEELRDVYKQPATDSGKQSKAGPIKLVRTEKGYDTVPILDPGDDELHTVFENGRLINVDSLQAIRERAQL